MKKTKIKMTKLKTKSKLNINEKYFKKYSKWFKNYDGNGGFNLFLTLLGKRKACNILLKNKKNKNKLEKILKSYKINYLNIEEDYFISNKIINKKKIIDEYHKNPKEHKYIGKLLDYPCFFDVRKDSGKNNTYSIRFDIFPKNNKKKLIETIFGYRCYSKDFNMNLIKKINNKRKLFEKTIKKEMPNLFSDIDVQLNIRVR